MSLAYKVNASLVEEPSAAGREVDAAEDLVVGHVQGEERHRRRGAELGGCMLELVQVKNTDCCHQW